MSSARGLFISAAVLALPKLTLTARLVLAEILNLHKVTGNVFARDSHFADRLNVSVRTIGNAIAELETQGYLTRPYDPAARQKRTLVLAEKSLQSLQGVVADFAGSPIESLQKLQPLIQEEAESDCNSCNQSLQNLQGLVAGIADINNIINNNPNTLSEGEGELAQLSASSTGEELDLQPVGEPTAEPAPTTSPTAQPRAGRAPRKRGATLPTGPAELLPTSCLLAEVLNPGGLAAKVQQLAEPLTLAQAERLLAEYNLPALKAIFCEMANWPKLLTNSTSANLTARNWLSKRPKADTAPFPASSTTGAPASQPAAPAYDPAVLFGLDLQLTSEQLLARQQSTPEYAAYIARQQQAGQAPTT